MDGLFSQLSAQEAKSLFQELDGKTIILWIWEHGDSEKKIPINTILKRDFTFLSSDDLIPKTFRRASLLGTFEYRGFYYFIKILSREYESQVQFLCEPIIHKNERRKRKRFQVSLKRKDYIVVIPLAEPPPVMQTHSNVFSLFPIKLFKNFLSHLTTISEGRPLYHVTFNLVDLSASGLSLMADSYEADFLKSKHFFSEGLIIFQQEKLQIKNLEFVHRSSLEKSPEVTSSKRPREFFRIGMKFESDTWTSKKIQSLIEQEREQVLKEFDQWPKS